MTDSTEMTGEGDPADQERNEVPLASSMTGAIKLLRARNDELKKAAIIGKKEYPDKYVVVFSNGHKYSAVK